MRRYTGRSPHAPIKRECSQKSKNLYFFPFSEGGLGKIFKAIRSLPPVLLIVVLFTGIILCFLACSFNQTALAQPPGSNHVDSTAPEIISFSINHQDAVTDIHEVTLQLEASDDFTAPEQLQVRFSNDGVEWSDWQDYRTDWEWILAGGDGMKQVDVQVRSGRKQCRGNGLHTGLCAGRGHYPDREYLT